MAQAGCHKPLRKGQARGPQHQVKPAASTNLQSGSRAAHVTAKAKSVARNSEEAGATDSGVVMRAVTNNAAGAKGPCGGEASEAGTHEGMTGKTGSNLPDGRESADQVRHLQRRLRVAAKRSPDRRFHALMHRIWRGDVLRKPWSRVKRNRGSAGVDRETLVEIEQYGVERMLQELGDVLRGGAYLVRNTGASHCARRHVIPDARQRLSRALRQDAFRVRRRSEGFLKMTPRLGSLAARYCL